MLRLKLILTLGLSIVVVFGALALLLSHSQEKRLRADLDREILATASNLEQFERLNDFSVIAKAQAIAGFPGLQEALTQDYRAPADPVPADPAAPAPAAPGPDKDPEYLRHLAVHAKGLLRWKFVFDNLRESSKERPAVQAPLHERPPAFPELVFVTDDKGVSVAALGTNKYDWFKTPVGAKRPSLLSVSDGNSRKDIWTWAWSEGEAPSPYHVGFAPVFKPGPTPSFAGVVVVGSLISDGSAKLASEAIGGANVAYFLQGRVAASTLPHGEELTAALLGDPKTLAQKPASLSVRLGGREYLAAPRLFTDNADLTAPPAGFVVLIDVSERLAPLQTTRSFILGAALALLLLQLGAAIALLQGFIKPLEELDQGIQEVLTGNRDYVFKTSSNQSFHVELAQALNNMAAFLQNKRMPDEEDVPDSAWGNLMVGDVSRTAKMRALGTEEIPKIAPQEDEPAYRARLFSDYITALQNLGQPTANITEEKFFAQLDKEARALREKHNAREVRFSVVIADGKLVLKPQPIL